MTNLLDAHAKRLKNNVKRYGRPVTLTDPENNTYSLTAIWNDVEHGLKIDSLAGDPMGAKASLYFDRDSLQLEAGEIKPTEGWTATGSPNRYDPDKDYKIRIPKSDNQLPGLLFFLESKDPTAQAWTRPADQG